MALKLPRINRISLTVSAPASASNPNSGAVGAGGDAHYKISPALKKLHLKRSPSDRRRHPFSCVRTLPLLKRGLSSIVTLPFTHTTAQSSSRYPLAYFVPQPVDYLHSSLDYACYTTPMCLSPPLDVSAWVEIASPCSSAGHHHRGSWVPGCNTLFSHYSVTGLATWYIEGGFST